jgi:hypothetical protein
MTITKWIATYAATSTTTDSKAQQQNAASVSVRLVAIAAR